MNGLFLVEGTWQAFGNNLYAGTFSIFFSCIDCIHSFSYNLAKSYDQDALGAGAISVASFFLH